jgi:hypothetical protein
MDSTDRDRWEARWIAELDDLFGQSLPRSEQARRLAALLLPLAPTGWSFCQLTAKPAPVRAWTSPSPQPADLDRRLEEELERLDSSCREVMRLSDLDSRTKMKSQAVALDHAGQKWGFLGLVHPRETASANLARAEPFLLGAARLLALYLQLESETTLSRALLRHQKESQSATLLGDAIPALVHEVNNHLNQILLQAAIVQTKVDPSVREELGLIRREGKQAADLLRPLQQVWQDQSAQTIDLNILVREVVEALGEGPKRIPMNLAAMESSVPSAGGALRRLVSLLIQASLSCQSGEAPPIGLRTWNEEGKPRLTLEGAWPPLSERGQANPFDAEHGPLAHRTPLERLAVQSLLRLCGAILRAAPTESGVALTIAWS